MQCAVCTKPVALLQLQCKTIPHLKMDSRATVDLRGGNVSQHLQSLHSTGSRFKQYFTSLLISARNLVFKSMIWRGGKIWFFLALFILALKCTCLTTVSCQFRAEVDKIWILK